jgi:ketosteroid isomerase-like protein
MSDTRAVVEAFFAKASANDLGVVDLFADDIEFFAPGDPKCFPWAGMHTRGGAALREVFKSVWESRAPGTGRVDSSKLIVEGEDAVWVGRGVSHEMGDLSRNRGQRFAIDVAIHFTVRNGKIVTLYAIEDMTALARVYGF